MCLCLHLVFGLTKPLILVALISGAFSNVCLGGLFICITILYTSRDTGWLKAVVYTLAGIGGVIGDLNYYESTQKLCTTYFVYLSLSLSFELLRTILTQILNIPSYIYICIIIT